MFSPVKMARLDVLLLKKDARAALRGLGRAGVLELAESAELAAVPGEKSGAVRDCESLLLRLRDLSRAAVAVTGPASGGLSFDEARAALEKWEGALQGPLRLRGELAEKAAGFSAAAEKLAPYAGLPLPSAGKEFSFLYSAAGTLPAENLDALRAKLPAGSVLLPLAESEGRLHAVALGPRPAEELAELLKRSGFQAAVLPGRPGFTLAALAAYYAEQERDARSGLEKAGSELRSLAGAAAGPLASAGRAFLAEKRLLEAEEGLGRTGTAVLISGWTPADAAAGVAGALSGASGGRCAAETARPGAGGDIPVLLRPPRLFRPFLALVTAYGLPRYGEVEPTVFAAVLFLLLFGMMFGDAGQGAVVCLGGLWAILKGHAAARDAGKVVFACGLSAILFGFLYGGFFGMEGFRKYALWRDPLEGDPLLPLKAALAAGVAVISLGLALNVVNRFRAGDLPGAALGRFGLAGLLFYWSGVSLAAGFGGPRLLLPLMGLAAACWLATGPVLYLLRRGGEEEKNGGFFAVAAEALAGAFEGALLYLSNTVSFVRLAAYAMSHSALLASAWALRDAADKTWGPGSAAGLVAVVAGNAAAIGLEGLVAAVQALRLEYYEFFGKFFEGGGRAFRPFELETKEER